MTSFGHIRRYMATIASQPRFTLYVIHLIVRALFSMFLVLVYSVERALLCIYIFSFSLPYSYNERLIDLRRQRRRIGMLYNFL